MSDEEPKAIKRGLWPVVAAVVLIVAIYFYTQYGLMKNQSALEQRVEVCTAGYRTAHTASDTAKVDVTIPPSGVLLRASQTKNCEYYRKAGTTK
jgi:hypothetical protein